MVMVSDYFADSTNKLSYADVQLGPCLYQDDVSLLSTDLESAQDANNRMEAMAESKLLDLNLDKLCLLVVGNKKQQKKNHWK